jgi:hypothetical protein
MVAAFFYDHMVSPKEHKDMLYATYRLKIVICFGIKDISP